MYGHLEMMRSFIDDSKVTYGIFCEDDVYLNKHLNQYLPQIISDVEQLQLDILLLGYLINFTITDTHPSLPRKTGLCPDKLSGYTYHEYPDNLWGSQMYMITRKQAQLMWDCYAGDYAVRSLSDPTMTPFSADWTLTKDGQQRALINPMLCVENGQKRHNDPAQDQLHYGCFKLYYHPDLFI